MRFDWFLESFKYTGQGLLCIFIVTGVIIGSILLLNKLTAEKKKDDNNQ